MSHSLTFLLLCVCILVIVLATCSGRPVELLEVHGPNGQVAYVNAAEISTLRAPSSTDLNRYFPPGTRCVISTTNGKFIAATETCAQIRDRIGRPTP